jgi:hypothetical protein
MPPEVIAAARTESIPDGLRRLKGEFGEIFSDIGDLELQNKLIDFIRANAGMESIDHDRGDLSWTDKLADIFLGSVNSNDPADMGMFERIFENVASVVTGGGYETAEEKVAALAEQNEVARVGFERENTIAEANRTVSSLLGSDRNWQRFFNFLTGRDVMMLGPSTEIDTLQEIWNAVAVDQVEGMPSAEGADSLNLQRPEDRQRFKEILANPGIYQRQFGTAPPEDDVERDGVIDEFINTVQGRTNFIVVGGMANSLLQNVEGLDINEAGRFEIPAAEEGGAPTPLGYQDFFVPTFDGTQQGVVRGVGDLIAGMSINPQEVQDRLNQLPDDQLALVQSQLWQFGYFDSPAGREDFQWRVSDDSTYRAMERMLVDLLTEQRDNGPNYSVETMLTDRRRDRSIRMRETFVGAEVDEKRAIRNSVIQDITSGMGGPVNNALNLALEESGVTLTTKGRALFQEKVDEALTTVGMTQPELDAAYVESQRRDDTEMLLAAYYTDGSFVGDWSQNITVGGNTDSDWADFGIMAGVITPDEANILYSPTSQFSSSSQQQTRQTIRQKLEENEVQIARTAMNWWLAQQTYTDTQTNQQTVSHVDALRGYANTIGRYTASMNEYDDNTFNQLSESLTGPIASQWLLDETQGADIPGDVADRIAQAAVDALALPDAAPDISGAGGIKNVLQALAGTGGPRGLRYG